MSVDNDEGPLSGKGWELLPGGEQLSPLLRVVYVLCALAGTVLTCFSLLVVIVEIYTSPTMSAATKWMGAILALFSAAHVFREARSTRPISWFRWLAFAGALTFFAIQIWTTISGSTAKQFFVATLGLGGLLLMVARLLVRRDLA